MHSMTAPVGSIIVLRDELLCEKLGIVVEYGSANLIIFIPTNCRFQPNCPSEQFCEYTTALSLLDETRCFKISVL